MVRFIGGFCPCALVWSMYVLVWSIYVVVEGICRGAAIFLFPIVLNVIAIISNSLKKIEQQPPYSF